MEELLTCGKLLRGEDGSNGSGMASGGSALTPRRAASFACRKARVRNTSDPGVLSAAAEPGTGCSGASSATGGGAGRGSS